MSGIIGKREVRGSGVVSRHPAPVLSVSGSTGVVADSDLESIDHDSLVNFVEGEHFTQANITATGTITSGTWASGSVAEGYGGTGKTGYAEGDMLYSDETDSLERLPKGNDNYVLTMNGNHPNWEVTQAPEGTAVLSTGESGTAKFLRINGDNSSSWQPVPAPSPAEGEIIKAKFVSFATGSFTTTSSTFQLVTEGSSPNGDAKITSGTFTKDTANHVLVIWVSNVYVYGGGEDSGSEIQLATSGTTDNDNLIAGALTGQYMLIHSDANAHLRTSSTICYLDTTTATSVEYFIQIRASHSATNAQYLRGESSVLLLEIKS